MRVLIVEDDPELGGVLTDGLREQSIETTLATSAPDGRDRALLGTYDVIVLDVLLPGGNGYDVCRELRAREVSTPILMLTARDAVDDRVQGLEAGADDYLTKPFAFRELLARLSALERRRPLIAPSVQRTADLEIDYRARTARRGATEIRLTAKEFALLECLARHEGQVVDRAKLTSFVWDENHDPFTNVLEVLVRRVRRKVDDPFALKLIHTVRGAGYRFQS